MTNIFYMETEQPESFLPFLKSPLLDKENQARLASKKGNAQLQSLIVHLLSLHTVSQFLPAESIFHITRSPLGQPLVSTNQESPVFLSCSHTDRKTFSQRKNLFICGVSSAAIGVDAEYSQACPFKIAKRMFHPDEQEFLKNSSQPDETFLQLWTLREAYGKLLGKGLVHMPVVCFDLSQEKPVCSDSLVDAVSFSWKDAMLSTVFKKGESVSFQEVPESSLLNLCNILPERCIYQGE